MSSLLDVGDNAHANTNGSGIVSGSASRRPKDVSTLDLGLMQRVPSALSHRDHRRGGSVGTGTPLTAMSEASTTASSPTTPHGHPLRHAGHLLSLPHGPAPTPVPIVSIMPLCLARIAEGLIFAVIFREYRRMLLRR